MLACIDPAEENMVVAQAQSAAHVLDDRWNGWARQVATAAEFADVLGRWTTNDPHGTWGHVCETSDGLRYEDSEGSDADLFAKAGASEEGQALYDLTGWVWVRI